VLSLRADHAGANFLLGQLLLRQNDPAGVAHLEQASSQDPEMLIPACQILFAHFTAAGQPEEAERYREQAQEFIAKLEEAQPERATITPADELIPHQADPAEVERLRDQLRPFPLIQTAYLAQKKLEKFPERPLYVLGIVTTASWYQLNRAESNRELIGEIVSRVEFTAETLVIVLEGDYKKLLKKFRQLEGAQIFPRPD
jgi:lipopolysaccharide biosynthesis regulator YciM